MNVKQLFHGPNAGYLLELYETYQNNPADVDEQTRALFDNWQPTLNTIPQNGKVHLNGTATLPASLNNNVDVAALVNYANDIRNFGHMAANLDPLGSPPPGDPWLDISHHGLSEATLQQMPGHLISGPIGASSPTAAEAIDRLRAIYSSKTGFDFRHISQPEERNWLREAVETRRYHPQNLPVDNQKLLERLTQVEGFEQFLHKTFQGKKRFSIEGLDMMVPMLDQILEDAVEHDITDVVMGMAHRGRLNVLTHVLEKPYSEMLAEFKDIVKEHEDTNWTGDVKYHEGATRQIEGLTVTICANPSHLELVNPVVEGMARASGTSANQRGEVRFNKFSVMPILIHGDAAFAGQGIVAETLNLNELPGWRTGGTIHFIANNQIGFTTDFVESRSTPYASDVAKGYRVPIIHVNADDVEACIEVARIAFAYQEKFEKDFLIDLIGYRRYGHNEGDEPRFTQPVMYGKIKKHKTVRTQWADTLTARGLVSAADSKALEKAHFAEMQVIFDDLDKQQTKPLPFVPDPPENERIQTAVSAETLRQFNKDLLNIPEGVQILKGLKRVLDRRAKALDTLDESAIDWGQAESLAFASILADGTSIRITGEDVERGTFSHRHAVLRNQADGARHIPLQKLAAADVGFECRNSPLSENAAIGFEYGYSIVASDRLTIWEAQFGDFVNGAQPIIDEYISSGKAKWDLKSGMVLLLPHGYEGQGPDHSTARLGRWLQLAADSNMRIVNPTTAAQYFHLLRRQVNLISSDPRPLIVMSPKKLLRHDGARSSLRELSEGVWQPIIDDPTIDGRRRRFIKRLVLCSGKVYVDAMESGHRPEKPKVALARVEQLYRFPLDEVKELISSYSGLEEVVWLQEEPKNGGAWNYVKPLLHLACGEALPVRYVGRPHRASPAEGSLGWHKITQEQIIGEAYQL